MSPNLAAFLELIKWAEGTDAPGGERALFSWHAVRNPGMVFDSFADHPRRAITANGYTSTAAGWFQILAGTWDDYCKAKGGPRPFTPENQVDCAIWLIQRRGALEDVEAGRIGDAIAKCAKEWASLPGSPYGQPMRTLGECLSKFDAALREFALPTIYPPAQPAPKVTPENSANTSDYSKPVNPVARIPIVGPAVIALLGALQAVPDVVKLFAGKQPSEMAQRNTALAEKLVDVAVTSLKAAGPGEALDKLTTDPTAVQTVAAAIKADPGLQLLLVEAGGGGIGGARAFVSQAIGTPQGPAMTSILRVVTFWVLGFLTFANVAGFALAGVMVWLKLGEWQQITSTLIQADINAAFAAIGFWLGSSLAKGGTPAANVRSD